MALVTPDLWSEFQLDFMKNAPNYPEIKKITLLNKIQDSPDKSNLSPNPSANPTSSTSYALVPSNSFEAIIKLDIALQAADFSKGDFRSFLIDYLKEYYENHAFYTFFIEKIYYEELEKQELPLFFPRNNFYVTCLPVKCKMCVFRPKNIVEMVLNFNISKDGIIEAYAENKYLSCKISHEGFNAIKYNDDRMVLKNTTTGETLNATRKIFVKLETFHNNKVNIGFSKKINCSGKLTQTGTTVA